MTQTIAQDGEDFVLPFQLESTPVRGRLVRLRPAITTLLRKHDYPSVVNRLLAEATAMTAALGTALKFDGVFTLQTKTDGPVRMLVVDVTSGGAIRACAQYDKEKIVEASGDGALLGQGHLVFTVDQIASDDRYQGIVGLTGEGLTQAFQLYFRQSEQIPTGLMAAARQGEDGTWCAASLMVQRMPKEGGTGGFALSPDSQDEEDWHRVMMLMNTCGPEELADAALAPEELLFRLFHEEGIRVYEPTPLRHECRCSAEKIKGVLSGMPKQELVSMVQEDGRIAVTCQFCSAIYSFSPDDFP